MIKSKICVFVLLLLLVCININANNNTLPLFGKVIYLDPGHGGLDPGAMYAGIKEKDINLELTKKLENKLLKLGAVVYLTRNGDYDLARIHNGNRKRSDLSRRVNLINESKCDLFLSVHLNAENTNIWRGAQVFYDDTNKENKDIANIFGKVFRKRLYTRRKVKKVNDLYLQRRVKRPGILVEMGFISNANDRYLLKTDSYQDKVANAIVEGVLLYFKKSNTVI